LIVAIGPDAASESHGRRHVKDIDDNGVAQLRDDDDLGHSHYMQAALFFHAAIHAQECIDGIVDTQQMQPSTLSYD
jgi:hypothetical protein